MMQFKAGDRVQDKAKPSFKWVIQAVGLDGKTIVVAAEKHLLVRAWLPSSWFEKATVTTLRNRLAAQE
tara:strand:+ start:345 stop:548 length:204 start_codon:yes stop_codon:yes gene_type:complete